MLLIAVRIPFYLTGHIQEDAYIAFRTAANLADTGVYGFNAGERVSACTSHVYVFLLALLCKISPHFIVISLVLNTAALVVACYLLATLIFAKREQVLRLWICVSLAPVPMLASYAGMELSLVILLIAAAAWAIANGKPAASAAALFLLPWTRPDAVLVAGLLVCYAGWIARRVPWVAAAGLIAGVVSLAAFNLTYFGEVLNHSIVAKQVAFHPQHSFALFVRDLITLTGRVFLPFYMKALLGVAWLFAVPGLFAIGYLMWRLRHSRLVLIAVLSFAPCAAYAAGGIFFVWYLWPSQVLISLLVLAAALEFAAARPRWMVLIGAVVFMGLLGQWARSYSIGVQESKYRAGVGRRLKEISKPSDSIMLEPIGYIPYYAQRYTHDAIGLASPEVTRYRREFGSAWWVRYLRDFRPTYYIERTHLQSGITVDGDRLTPPEIAWFRDHYRMIESFRYRPEDFGASRLARPQTIDDYDIYRVR